MAQHAEASAKPVVDMTAPQKGRKNPRTQVSLVARYRSPTAFEFVQEECFDLSAGGMFIKSPAPAPPGTLIKLECDVDHGAQTIRGVARVVWLREQDADGQPAGMGVKFVKLEAGGREALDATLKRLGAASDNEPADAGARRSQPPARGAGPSPRPSPPPIPQRPAAATQVAEVGAGEPTLPTPKLPAPPPPVPPALPGGRRDSAKAPTSSGATPARAKAAQPTTAATADARGGARTIGFVAALALAAIAVYATQINQKATEQTAKLPTPMPVQPEATPPTPTPAEVPAEAPVAASEAATEPATLPAAIVQPQPAPEPKYVLEIATTPEGARVTAGELTLIAPGTLELGALVEPVQLHAEKEGFEPASAVVDRVGFMLDDGLMRRRIALTLVEQPKPEPVAAQAPAPAAPVASKPARATQKPAKPKPPAERVAVAEPATEPSSAAQAVPAPAALPIELAAPDVEAVKPTAVERAAPAKPAKLSPMDAASACLATGDNACVVKTLEGKAKTARELELLIETYRALGNTDKAEKQMQVYVNKYPNERHTNSFRRVLERRQSEALRSN